jgi:hypothetical protein
MYLLATHPFLGSTGARLDFPTVRKVRDRRRGSHSWLFLFSIRAFIGFLCVSHACFLRLAATMVLRNQKLAGCVVGLLSSYIAAATAAAAAVTATATAGHRQLQQQEGDPVDGYQIRQGTCFRVKVDQDNDDDGNAYFYNGAYRSQYQRYMSFSFCDVDNSASCTEYVTELDTYVATAVEYVQTYCSSCASSCSGRRRAAHQEEIPRFLADQAAEVWNVNCNTCASECSRLNKNSSNNNNGEGGLDESQYLDCQQAANYEEGGLVYYTAPQCENGQVVIGHFYDNKCTIKTSTLQDAGFNYHTFRTIQSTALVCAVHEDSCYDLFEEAIYCGEHYEDGEQEASLCKAAKAAGRTYTYYKKPFYKKVPLVSIGFLFLLLTTAFSFLAYTYYVRHSRSKVIPMAQFDGEAATTDVPEKSNDLPPLS